MEQIKTLAKFALKVAVAIILVSAVTQFVPTLNRLIWYPLSYLDPEKYKDLSGS